MLWQQLLFYILHPKPGSDPAIVLSGPKNMALLIMHYLSCSNSRTESLQQKSDVCFNCLKALVETMVLTSLFFLADI